MGGLYAVNPPGFRVSGRDREKRFLPDIDGNFTDGIPGNPGDPFYLRPDGYWNGGNDWQTEQIPDATQDYLVDDPTGKSTGDLIAEDGTVKTFLPPNSRHFILGPLVDGYVQNHNYDNYSNIGYIQKDTRQFVLLARIQGQFTADLHQEGARVWDGTAGQLTIYNSNFTLAMAEWFRDQITAGTFTNNVPYFYSGGVPQQPISGGPSCPNCPPNMFGGAGAGTPKAGGGFGQGGPGPKLGTPQGPPNPTGPEGAGYPWGPNPLPNVQPKTGPFGLTPEQQTTAMNALMLGLDIAAVLAVVIPEPGSSAAGAAHLASKLRYASKLMKAVKKLNPFRRAPKPKVTYSKNILKPSKVKYGDGVPKQTPKPPKYDPKQPGGGAEWQKAARNFQRQNPGQYNPFRSDAANKLMKNQGVGTNPSSNPKFRKPMSDGFDYELYAKALECISEAAPTGSGAGGGTEIADAYVDGVAKTSSPEQLEQASDDANDIAAKGGMAMSASSKSKIDKEAEEEARRLTNIDTTNPNSLSDDQLYNAIDMMYESNPERFSELYNKHENLIDQKAIDEGGEQYEERLEYIRSWDNIFAISPSFASQYRKSESLYNTYVTKMSTREGVTEDGTRYVQWMYNGEVQGTGDLYYDKLVQWADLNKKTWDTYENEVPPRQNKQREEAAEDFNKIMRQSIRKFTIALMNDWSSEQVDDDPFSLKDLTVTDIQNMSEADKKRLRAYLSKMGLSYGNIASADVMDLSVDATAAIIGLGLAGVKLLWDVSTSTATNLINAVSSSDPYGKDQAGPTVTGQPLPGAVDLTPKQQAEVEAAGNELRDAQRALRDIQDNPNATDSQIEMAQERLDRARKNRARLRKKHREENKNRRESYIPKFCRNRKPLTETRTPKQRKILREIKQPIKVKEAPTKYKMNFEGRYSSQNTPDKTGSNISDDLVMKANARGQRWRTADKYWSGYETTEKMNIIQDRTGHGQQAWDHIVNENANKKEWRDAEIQEKLNMIAHEKAMLKENPDFSSPFGNIDVSPTTKKNKQNFDKVNKIKRVMADKNTEKLMSQIAPEYPSNSVPQPDEVTNLHPKLQSGENASAYYKKLDPTSADSMPDAAYPQIDKLRDKARKKAK